MDYKFLGEIRETELEVIVRYLPPNARLLEIGAGAGWQARKLADAGFDVSAIDVEQQNLQNYNYEKQRVFDVTVYDGRTIPFPDASFDCIYSSNVLEHIPHVLEFQSEIMRVLKAGGICVHALPSPSWRFWSIIAYYLVRLKNAFVKTGLNRPKKVFEKGESSTKMPLVKRLIIRRHGERGNVLTEFYLFSRAAWKKLFSSSGWQILQITSGNVFYSGEYLLGSKMPLNTRSWLGKLIGQPINIFILRNGKK